MIKAACAVTASMSEEMVRRKLGNSVLSEKDGEDAVKEICGEGGHCGTHHCSVCVCVGVHVMCAHVVCGVCVCVCR